MQIVGLILAVLLILVAFVFIRTFLFIRKASLENGSDLPGVDVPEFHGGQ